MHTATLTRFGGRLGGARLRLRRRSAPLFRSQLLGWRRLGADVRCGVLRFIFGCRVFCGIGGFFVRDAGRVNFVYMGAGSWIGYDRDGLRVGVLTR